MTRREIQFARAAGQGLQSSTASTPRYTLSLEGRFGTQGVVDSRFRGWAGAPPIEAPARGVLSARGGRDFNARVAVDHERSVSASRGHSQPVVGSSARAATAPGVEIGRVGWDPNARVAVDHERAVHAGGYLRNPRGGSAGTLHTPRLEAGRGSWDPNARVAVDHERLVYAGEGYSASPMGNAWAVSAPSPCVEMGWTALDPNARVAVDREWSVHASGGYSNAPFGAAWAATAEIGWGALDPNTSFVMEHERSGYARRGYSHSPAGSARAASSPGASFGRGHAGYSPAASGSDWADWGATPRGAAAPGSGRAAPDARQRLFAGDSPESPDHGSWYDARPPPAALSMASEAERVGFDLDSRPAVGYQSLASSPHAALGRGSASRGWSPSAAGSKAPAVPPSVVLGKRRPVLDAIEQRYINTPEDSLDGSLYSASKAKSLHAPWGHYVYVPIFAIFNNFLLVAIQFTIYLTLMGWLDTFLEPSSDAVRGLVNFCAPGWSVAIYATFSELLLCRRSTFVEWLVSAMAFTASCVFLASLPVRLGFVVQVMGGVVIHFLGMLICGVAAMVRGGTTLKESLTRVCYFLSLFACAFFTAAVGYLTCFFWPILDDGYSPWIAGPALSFASNFGENASVVAVKRLDRIWYKWIPNSRTMGSWTIMFIHSVSESFRLVTLWYSAIKEAGNNGWIIALLFGLCVNLVNRLGWQTYFLWRLTLKHPFWIPSCWTVVHRDSKYGFGYGRFGAPLAVVGARYFLGTKETLFFNKTVLYVWVFSFLTELLEDFGTAFCGSIGFRPDWYSDERVLEFVDNQNVKDPDNAVVSVCRMGDGRLADKVNASSFDSQFLALSITNASTFLAYSGLVMLVSLRYLLGFSSEPVKVLDDIYNGALLSHNATATAPG